MIHFSQRKLSSRKVHISPPPFPLVLSMMKAFIVGASTKWRRCVRQSPSHNEKEWQGEFSYLTPGLEDAPYALNRALAALMRSKCTMRRGVAVAKMPAQEAGKRKLHPAVLSLSGAIYGAVDVPWLSLITFRSPSFASVA